MSDTITINECKISKDEFNKVKISAMSDRPNAGSSYGGAKKSAADIKKAFDKPIELLIDKHNALIEAVLGKESELDQSEAARAEAEAARAGAEAARAEAETARIEAENARAEAELAREAAEEKRNETIGDVADALKKLIDYQDALLDGYHGSDLPVVNKGDKGDTYTLTAEDKSEISAIATEEMQEEIGDINTALDSILAIQSSLIGGDAQ